VKGHAQLLCQGRELAVVGRAGGAGHQPEHPVGGDGKLVRPQVLPPLGADGGLLLKVAPFPA